VVDRVGLRCEGAYSDEALQRACREKSAELPQLLVVATDGSMLLTREEGWKEAKVGVVARGDAIREEKQRSRVEEAQYVAACLGDWAKGTWTTASELCPPALQVLDIPHAVHWGMECSKASHHGHRLGESSSGGSADRAAANVSSPMSR
jgi:hypothetical protein